MRQMGGDGDIQKLSYAGKSSRRRFDNERRSDAGKHGVVHLHSRFRQLPRRKKLYGGDSADGELKIENELKML
jgi:hypothetical protein